MKLRKNEEAVSPVIGVILMVVITVIIAAILAVFAFGIGVPAKAPTANIKVTADSAGLITLEHQGGDPLVWTELQYVVTAADGSKESFTDADITKNEVPVTGNAFFATGEGASFTLTTAPAAGDRITVTVIHVPTNSQIINSQVTVTSAP